jgi:hypothetical protein
VKYVVGIATGYGLDDGGAGIRVPVGSMGTGSSFPGDKAAGARS